MLKSVIDEQKLSLKKKDDEMYQMRLEYEERGRKQMESYARELSIRYANSDDNDTINRLKEAGDGLVKEKKELEKKIKTLEKQVKYSAKVTPASSSKKERALRDQVKTLQGKMVALEDENVNLRRDLESSVSMDIVNKLEGYRQREEELENQVRTLKRDLEKMKIKYE